MCTRLSKTTAIIQTNVWAADLGALPFGPAAGPAFGSPGDVFQLFVEALLIVIHEDHQLSLGLLVLAKLAHHEQPLGMLVLPVGLLHICEVSLGPLGPCLPDGQSWGIFKFL